MDRILAKKRQYYFGFLFFSFVYFGIAILIIKEIKPFSLEILQEFFLILGALIPAVLFFLRNKLVTLRGYIILLLIGQIPMVIGFLLSVFYKNYIYIMMMFPVFVLAYLIVIPLEGKGYGLSRKSK